MTHRRHMRERRCYKRALRRIWENHDPASPAVDMAHPEPEIIPPPPRRPRLIAAGRGKSSMLAAIFLALSTNR